MKIIFTGAVLQPSWPGGEPVISRMLDQVFSAQGIEVSKCFVPRNHTAKVELESLDLSICYES